MVPTPRWGTASRLASRPRMPLSKLQGSAAPRWPSIPILAIPLSNGTDRLGCLGAPRFVPWNHRASKAHTKVGLTSNWKVRVHREAPAIWPEGINCFGPYFVGQLQYIHRVERPRIEPMLQTFRAACNKRKRKSGRCNRTQYSFP